MPILGCSQDWSVGAWQCRSMRYLGGMKWQTTGQKARIIKSLREEMSRTLWWSKTEVLADLMRKVSFKESCFHISETWIFCLYLMQPTNCSHILESRVETSILSTPQTICNNNLTLYRGVHVHNYLHALFTTGIYTTFIQLIKFCNALLQFSFTHFTSGRKK
jgi:hypothetical protein